MGVLLALAMLAAIWQMVERLTLRRLVFAIAASVLAVHALYQNALILLAVCASAGLIAAIRRDAKLAAALGVVGGVCALSLMPYIGVIKRASEWNQATAVRVDLERIWMVLQRALSASGGWMPWLWGAAIISAAAAALISVFRRERSESRRGAQLSVFLLATVITATLAYYVFLKFTKFPTEEWYYLLWMAIAAVPADALLTSSRGSSAARIVSTHWS